MREDGVAAVEFAIISVVLIMILTGVISFGIVYSKYQVFQGAAREGARYAAVRATEAEVQQRVRDAAGDYAGDIVTPITVSRVCDGDSIGEPVTVSWSQSFSLQVAFVPLPTVTRDISAVFRCE
jgi:Flp pilus assembly protein TadG